MALHSLFPSPFKRPNQNCEMISISSVINKGRLGIFGGNICLSARTSIKYTSWKVWELTLFIDLRTRLWVINLTNSVVISLSIVLRSIVSGWILIYRNWSTTSSAQCCAYCFQQRCSFLIDFTQYRYESTGQSRHRKNEKYFTIWYVKLKQKKISVCKKARWKQSVIYVD